ncbi:MAG: hypothetical protein RRA35_00845, partial [Desulfomonilia bacterium]|nr:hypothetical protein [Desulfomonilia bacterium]
IMVGAVLTQNTAWKNVEKAIACLKSEDMLDIKKLHDAEQDQLASLIRSSGYFNIKAKRLKNLISTVMEQTAGDLAEFFDQNALSLRSSLLAVNGIGKETADSICCYAADKLIFVVDAYTARILARHEKIENGCEYDRIRSLFESGLPRDLQVYKDLHAYLVFVGKDHCRKTTALCEKCPLARWS